MPMELLTLGGGSSFEGEEEVKRKDDGKRAIYDNIQILNFCLNPNTNEQNFIFISLKGLLPDEK
jgi:hypothetical protein